MAKYKVQPNETWSTIAAKFKLPVPKLMSANSGTTTLSTGQGISVPQYTAPIGPLPTGGNLPSRSLLSTSVPTMANGFSSGRFGPVPTQPTTPPVTANPASPVAGRGTGNFAMNFQTTAVGANPSYTSNPNYRGYGGVQYERDPVTGRPAYNYIQQRDSNGNLLYNADGSKATTPASMYNSDIVTEARRNGQSVEQFTADLKSNGYVQFGGAWVYVAPPPPKVDYSRPLRNANGNLVRRREPTSTPIQFDDTGTASTNFGVGAG